MAELDRTDSTTRQIVESSFNRKENAKKQIVSLYPNPTKSNLNLRVSALQEGDVLEYHFFTLMGQELLHNKTKLLHNQISISDFAPGTYIFKIILPHHSGTWKVIKEE